MIHNMNVGGTEKSLLSLISVLRKEYYEVTVLMLEARGGYLKDIPKWVNVIVLKDYEKIKPIIFLPPIISLKKEILNLKFVKAFHIFNSYVKAKYTNNWVYFYEYALKKYPRLQPEYDLAIAYAGPSDFITYFTVNKIKALKKIQWIHFDISKLKINKKFGDKYYDFFSEILCVSHSSADNMRKKYPRFKEKINVFENIILKDEIYKLVDKGDSYDDDFKGVRICTLGRLSHEKGQFMIPIIVKRLKDLGYKFRWYCIGEGELRKRIESDIEKFDIKNELILLGLQKNPYRFLKDTNIYVQTSLHEGYGLTMREAKIINIPMVVTNVASAPEIIENGKTGLIVDVDEDSLFKGIRKMLDEEQLLSSIKRNLIRESKLENNTNINSKINRLLLQ